MTWNCNGRPPRVTWENPAADHQIVLAFTSAQDHSGQIAVSCTCLGRRYTQHQPIEIRTRWTAEQALAVWRAHLEEEAASS